MFLFKKLTLLAFSLLFALTACGGGGSTSNGGSVASTGVFLDSPVINIGYRTETLEGVTNSLGEYEYLEGETVTFFIGDLVFPSIVAKGTVTPLDIADTNNVSDSKVVNMIRLLQTLDQDGNPDNGITITDTAKSNATQVDFSLSESDFASSSAVTTLIFNAGKDVDVSELIPTNDAVSHFQQALDDLVDESTGLSFDAETLLGTYYVVFAAESGTHSYTFSADGSVNIIYADGTNENETWTVNSNGQLVFSGSIADIFSLTSGNQSSGNLSIVIDDKDGSNVINTTGTISDSLIEAPNGLSFNADTLLGTYYVVFAAESGTHRYTFSADGSVNIIYADGTNDNETWSVNSNGQLVFSGSIADIFTLTSGNQSSGNLSIVIDDKDGSNVINTTGTISDSLIDLTGRTATSVIIYSECPADPLGWTYTFTSTSMTLTGSDSWQTPGCITSPEETFTLDMTTLSSDFDIPFNCNSYPVCSASDLNQTISGIDQDNRSFTSTYSFNYITNVLTYTKSVEGTTFTETITL